MPLNGDKTFFKRHSNGIRRSRSVENPGTSFNLFDNSSEAENQSNINLDNSNHGSHQARSENYERIIGSNQTDEERCENVICESSSSNTRQLECAICLQPCVHPARLPCSHIFCFLCLKGIARGPHTCAMCRAPIPLDYTENPQLIQPPQLDDNDDYTWFYEGRNSSGWWQYDPRTSNELEQSYLRSENKTEILVAGYLYIVDFEEMMQYRKNEPARRRKIKRDLSSCLKKGIAGLRQPTLSGLNEAFSRLDLN